MLGAAHAEAGERLEQGTEAEGDHDHLDSDQ
jgi:hypothetical protein